MMDRDEVFRECYRDCKHFVRPDQCKCAWDHRERTESIADVMLENIVEKLWYGIPPSNHLRKCDYVHNRKDCEFYNERTEEEIDQQILTEKRQREDAQKT